MFNMLFPDILGRSSPGGLEGASNPGSGGAEVVCALFPQARSLFSHSTGESAGAVCRLRMQVDGLVSVFLAARLSVGCRSFCNGDVLQTLC